MSAFFGVSSNGWCSNKSECKSYVYTLHSREIYFLKVTFNTKHDFPLHWYLWKW